MTKSLWENKLIAWLHDPAEKSFVLFNDPSGHEGGTVKTLLSNLKDEIGLDSESVEDEIKKSDWIAASADRPQWPINLSDGRYEKWAQVNFAQNPVLIHTLTGDQMNLYDLSKVDFKKIKASALNYYTELLALGKDAKMKFLALWRFAPENREEIGPLWQLLPADTRVPDHSIWNHLDLTSAFAGSRFGGEETAVLAMAFGPVQSFIAQARSTSDLWAGSHLLSSIIWEGMKVIADEIGPDAFLFPQIRGLAIADLWLLEKAKEVGLEEEWRDRFKNTGVEWIENVTDTNPLFAACLPNKFSAIVPLSRAKELADKIVKKVRTTVFNWVGEALKQVTDEISDFTKLQIEEQMRGFPNVFWSVVEWDDDINEKSEFLTNLKDACSEYSYKSENFFDKDYWKCLKQEITIGGHKFYKPNAGVVYPAVYELSEKSLATSKTLREFEQLPQEGFRCTLCGEREWLSLDRDSLMMSPGERKNTIWGNSGQNSIKKGEHLCAVCALKRFWPNIFTKKVKDYLDNEVRRYVVSTHTMSLVPTLNALIEKSSIDNLKDMLELEREIPAFEDTVALPKKLYRACLKKGGKLNVIKKIPAYIDKLRNSDESDKEAESFLAKLKKASGVKPETYYALILMDGDNMGAWLSATEEERRIPYSASWHPKIALHEDVLKEKKNNKGFEEYFKAKKTASPTRHAVISQALNNFSGYLVPKIIEESHNGKLIYSGGDDVLAMAPTDDVLSIIKELRLIYGGFGKEVANGEKFDKNRNYANNGFVFYDRKLMQTMGVKASASVGVVIVHSKTPLAYALKCLREAEQRAKTAGRNAFCVRILKRAGGEISFTDNWWNKKSEEQMRSIELFEELIKSAAQKGVSRKTFYATEEWIHLLPEYSNKWSDTDWELSENMARAMLVKQFKAHGTLAELAEKTVSLVWSKAKSERNELLKNPIKQLTDMLYCAEFFARETRSEKISEKGSQA